MCINKIEAMFERPHTNVKVEQGLTVRVRLTFYTLLLFHLLRGYTKYIRGNERSHVKVEPDSTLTFACDTSYFALVHLRA